MMLRLSRRLFLSLALMALPLGVAAEAAQPSLDMTMGQADAPVTLVEYSSFTCPHCARFHEDILPRLKADYIDTGKVRLVFREVYFDRYGLWAGMTARCGGEARYFGMVDLIFQGQREWTSGSPVEIRDNLGRIARVAGLSQEQFDTCMSDAETAQSLYEWYLRHAEADGLEATPSLVINGKMHSNMSYDKLSALLDAELEG